MSLLTAKDPHVTCPYEISHQILLSRFQTHLVKCENAYRKKNKEEYVECPFNVTHKVMKLSLNAHVTYFCPDRHKIDTFIHKAKNELEPVIQPKTVIVEAEISENWDDCDEPTYNPEEHVYTKPVLILKQCVSRSERKAFRMQERLRHQEFGNANKNNENIQPSQPTLRLPQTTSQYVNVGDEDIPTADLSSLNSMSISNDTNMPKNDGFTKVNYGKGRGRGRINKN